MSPRDPGRPAANPTRREATIMGISLAAASAVARPTWAQGAGRPELPTLIPRATLFGNPDRSTVQVSHDGRFLSWLAPVDGVLNVHIAPIDDPAAARPVTTATQRPVYGYLWAYDNRTVIYADDIGGDENIRIFAVDTTTLAKRDLTPLAGVNAELHGASRLQRTLIAVGLNDRDPRWHDLWHIDIVTGERRLIRENSDQVSAYVLDEALMPRLVSRSQADGSVILYRVKGDKLDVLEPVLTVPFADSFTTSAQHITADGKAFYLQSSIGRDRAALFRVDLESGAQTLIAEHPKADVDGTLTDARTREVTAVSATYLREEWIAIDPAMEAEIAWLRNELKADFSLTGRTEDDTRWVIAASSAEQPTVYHLLDRPQRQLRRLLSVRPQLEKFTLAPMHGHVVRSRDGLDLVSYLTLPAGETGARPSRPLPLVLNVHGGPWARDTYGYDPEHQWLANRGHAVLAVNFRGSTGFGKAFVNAGDMEWAGRMHDDLIDAVNWAVNEGIADRERVAILGSSYGGYAALVGATFTPEVFRCAVSVVGVSNLETFIASIPPYWQSFFENLARRIGDPRTEAGRAHLRARSPLNRAHAIAKPLLILQGANDARVKQAESDQIVAAAKARGLPVTYALYPDEGHGFILPANRISSYAIIEAFLAQHLGGSGGGGDTAGAIRFEPIGTDLRGASLTVDGAHHVPGLAAALKERE